MSLAAAARRGVVFFGGVQRDDAGKLLLLVPIAIAAPEGANRGFGEIAHTAVGVDQRVTQHRV